MNKFKRYFLPTLLALFLFIPLYPALAVDLPYSKNEIKVGYFNRGFIHIDGPHPPSPIFWEATTKARNGVQLLYERLLYDNGGRFSVHIGVNVSRYEHAQDTFYAGSIFPSLRYWFIRSQYADFYFEYSVAGPTILSRRMIGSTDLGGRFIFQDFLGLGVVLGHHRAFNFDIRLVHYSNGDVLPKNPGFDVPVMVYLGYSF